MLARGGLIFAATNARELAVRDALPTVITSALDSEPAWQPLPPWPIDVTEPDRVAAVLFAP